MKKILLLHGWNWKNYPQFNTGSPWNDRSAFVEALRCEYEVDTPSIPGFGDSDIPQIPWDLDDYSKWLDTIISSKKYDAILGYSFGGAVLTHWCYTQKQEVDVLPKILLVSPAIVRKYNHSKSFYHHFPIFLKKLFRHFYLSFIIKNPYYIHGNKFQKETYQNIIKIYLSKELREILANKVSLHLFFGKQDTATPPELLFSEVPEARKLTHIFSGGHDIANTNTEELVETIRNTI